MAMTMEAVREHLAAKEADRASGIAKLTAAHPHLIPARGADGLTTAARNIRIELRRAFPGVKFGVKCSRFSGGDSISVRWTDGPPTSLVDSIVNRYAAGSFDGCTDSYTYRTDYWGAAFGDAKYTHTTRCYSDAAVASCARTMYARRGIEMSSEALGRVADDYRNGKLWGAKLPGNDILDEDLLSMLSRELSRRTWSIPKVAV